MGRLTDALGKKPTLRSSAQPPLEVDLTVEGIAEVLAELATFSDKVQTRHLRPATNAAMRVLLAEARRQSPRGNGFFRRSLIVVIRQDAGRVKAQLGQAKQPKTFKRKQIRGSQINRKGFAAPIHFIERPTAPHTIAPTVPTRGPGNRRSALAIGSGKKAVYRANAKHPGTKGNPVLERAARVAGRSAGIAFRDKLAERLKLNTS